MRKSLLKQSGKCVVDAKRRCIDSAEGMLQLRDSFPAAELINPPSHRSRRAPRAVGRWRIHELRTALITPAGCPCEVPP